MRPEYLAVLALVYTGQFRRYYHAQLAMDNGHWMESGIAYLVERKLCVKSACSDSHPPDYLITPSGVKLVHHLMDCVSS